MTKNPETDRHSASQESITSLLPDSLDNRDPSKRFTDPEKIILADTLSKVWESLSQTRLSGEIINGSNAIINGTYPNDAPKIWLSKEKIDSDRWQYINFPLERDSDLLGLTTYLWQKNSRLSTIGSCDFPSQLGDRNMGVNEVLEEGMVIGSHMRNLSAHHVKSLILFDNHSPVTSLLALKNGIRPLDLSTLPLLLSAAIEREWITNKDKIVVNPLDDGAKERGKLINFLLTSLHCNPLFVQAEKIKTTNHKEINFKDEDKSCFKDATVIIPEDRLVSGGTLVQGLEKIYAMGAKKVVILVPYAECINGATHDLKEFVDHDKLGLVITDGVTPRVSLNDIEAGLHIVPIRQLIQQVFKLDQQGVNFWDPRGKEALAQLGITHNPWQTMH